MAGCSDRPVDISGSGSEAGTNADGESISEAGTSTNGGSSGNVESSPSTEETTTSSTTTTSTTAGSPDSSEDGGANTSESGNVDVKPGCEVVEFEDPWIEEEAAKLIGHGPPFTGQEVAAQVMVFFISEESEGIESLVGLECAVNLEQMVLNENPIADLSPLTGLRKLAHVGLRANRIVDVTPLGTLPTLRGVDVSENQISDVSPFAELPALWDLVAIKNPIADLSPLGASTSLRHLVVNYTQITSLDGLRGAALESLQVAGNPALTDVSPVIDMPNLLYLELSKTGVSDLSPLLEITHWPKCDVDLFLEGTPLDAHSLEVVIPELCERKVRVSWTGGACHRRTAPVDTCWM